MANGSPERRLPPARSPAIMIPYEWMGVLALLILWTNVLLIAAATLKRFGAVRAYRRYLERRRPAEAGPICLRVEVARGLGPNGRLAALEIEQRGRQLRAKSPTIGWSDRRRRSRLFGGKVGTDDLEVSLPPSDRVEVWPHRTQLLERFQVPDSEAFDAAWPDAGRSKGIERTLELSVLEGDRVWVLGELRPRSSAWVLGPYRGQPVVISAERPALWSTRTELELGFFAVLSVGIAALITRLCLGPPLFGPMSTLGGVLGLAYFLLVQPAARWMEERAQTPAQRVIHGQWRRPGGNGSNPAPR